MITMDAFLSDFGEAIGIKGFALDAIGSAQLAIGAFVVDVLGDRTSGRLMLSCLLGELPDAEREAAMMRLLNANAMLAHTRGATLGVLPGSGAVVLARAVELTHETGSTFATRVIDLATAADELAPLLRQTERPTVARSDDTYLLRL